MAAALKHTSSRCSLATVEQFGGELVAIDSSGSPSRSTVLCTPYPEVPRRAIDIMSDGALNTKQKAVLELLRQRCDGTDRVTSPDDGKYSHVYIYPCTGLHECGAVDWNKCKTGIDRLDKKDSCRKKKKREKKPPSKAI